MTIEINSHTVGFAYLSILDFRVVVTQYGNKHQYYVRKKSSILSFLSSTAHNFVQCKVILLRFMVLSCTIHIHSIGLVLTTRSLKMKIDSE